MSFFSRLGERLQGAVNTITNLDRLVEEEEARGDRAPPPGTVGRAPMGPAYRHLNLHYITDHLIGPSPQPPHVSLGGCGDGGVLPFVLAVLAVCHTYSCFVIVCHTLSLSVIVCLSLSVCHCLSLCWSLSVSLVVCVRLSPSLCRCVSGLVAVCHSASVCLHDSFTC